MTPAEAIEAFRKANEDLTQANVRAIFKAKAGEVTLVTGDNAIVLPFDDDTQYSTIDEYEIVFHSALNGDTDITDALVIKDKTVNGFTVTTPRPGVLRWETHLKTPTFNFWT